MSRGLFVVYFAADPLTGRRSHWSLYLDDANASGVGTIFEAQGGLLQMTYSRVEKVTPSEEITYRGTVELCEISDVKIVEFEKIVEGTVLPSSPMKVPKGFVRKDGQDWVKDVVEGLVQKDIIPADTVEKLEKVPRMVMLE
jgi:hypothetical protein